MKSLLLTIIQKTTAILEFVSPKLAIAWANKLFFSPRSSIHKLPDIPNLQQNWLSYTKITGVEDKCKVYTAGNGPVVLLVHGWEGSAYSLSTIAKALLKENMKVVLFDLPAHGFSPGKKTNLVEISQIIQQLAKQETHDGQLQALIGHSFGAASAGFALKSGLASKHFISISAPTDMDFIFDQFCKTIGASATLRQALVNKVESILQGSYKQASLTTLASHLHKQGIRGLIAHDQRDRLIPFKQAENLSQIWQEARLLVTKGYGHNRILINKELIQAITDTVCNR